MYRNALKKIAALITAAAAAAGMAACRSDYTADGGLITTADPSLFAVVSETAVVTEAVTVTEAEKNSGPKVLLDREGSIIQVPEKTDTIISLSPAITEILAGIGAGNRLIAADTYSYDVDGISPEICSLDAYNLNAEEIIALAPDLVLIGGTSPAGADGPYAELEKAGVNVVYIPPSNSIMGIKFDIEFISAYLGLEDRGKVLTEEIDEAVEDISARAARVSERKKVYFELSEAPYLSSCGSGTLIDEIITLIGAENIYSRDEGRFPNSEESVIAANPDVIITSVSYEGYDFNEIKARAGWENIAAVKNGSVYRVGTNSLNRPSQNIIKGIYEMAETVYPEIYK